MTWLLSHRQRLRSLKWKKWKSRRWLQLCCRWDFMLAQVLFDKHLQKLQPNTLTSTCSSAMTYYKVGVPLRSWRKSLKFPELWRHWRYVFFSSSQPFPPQHQKTRSSGRLSNQSAFQCWICQAKKNVGVKGCGRMFFSQAKFHLVRWRCLWLTDLWALGKRCYVLTCLNGVRSPLKMWRRCQWLSRPSLSGTFFGVLFENWEKHDKLTNDSWSLKILEA